MATTYYTDIQKLYVAYFNRPADPAGIAYWEGRVEAANGSTAAVSAEFSTSSEYTSLYLGKSNGAIVDAVYQNLFGRAPDADGKAYWVGLMDSGKVKVDDVVRDVSNAAVGSDKTIFANKVTAASAFTSALDTPAKVAAYNADSIEIAKDFIAGITTDVTLNAAITPAALNGTIGEVVEAGGTFTVVGALASLQTAIDAEDAYLESITDEDADDTATPDSVELARDQALTAVHDKLVTLADASTVAAYENGSAAVKTAIINAQVTDNAEALAQAQSQLKTATGNVADVKDLTAAISTLTTATKSTAAAQKAVTNAAADLAAKVASYQTLHAGTTLNVATDGTVKATTGGVTVDLIVKESATSTKLVLADKVTETTNSGITALLSSSSTKEAADVTLDRATIVEQSAQNTVNGLDKPLSTSINETTAVTDLQTAMSLTVDATKPPTDAQIAAFAKTLAAGQAADDFQALVDTYHESNPRLTAVNEANAAVTAATKNITDFNEVVADLNTAQQHFDQVAGYEVTKQAAIDLFQANDYHLVLDLAAEPTATAESDVFVVGKVGADISLFGLQGEDSLFVGTGYTLNTGKLSAGDNAKMEIFVAQDGTDTTLQIEQHAFSSGVTGAASNTNEIVTIKLVGVTATDVHLDANGLITVA